MIKNALLNTTLLLSLLPAVSAYADDSVKYTLSLGAIIFSDFSSISDADYVGASSSMPLSLSIKKDDFRVSVSTAYLTQDQDNGTTDTGMADLNISVSYALNSNFSIAAKHKFATGDEALGFSSGEPDNTFNVDYFTMTSNKRAYFSSVSYKLVGKGGDQDRQNSASVSGGTSYTFSPTFTLASSLDYNQSSYTTSDDTLAWTVFGSHRLNNTWSLNWLLGTDSTQTQLMGTTLSYRF